MPRVAEQASRLPPKVSVPMITYNHAPFVAAAIESVLAQEVDFPVELVIGDDCSTDGTAQIVGDYARRHPHVIRLLARENNLGSTMNFSATLRECRGELLALLEGDDAWTDPQKLARQVRFLAAHPDCAVCFHDARVEVVDAENRVVEKKPFYSTPPPARVTFAEFVAGFYPPTAACLLVNDCVAFAPFYDGRLVCFVKTLIYCALARGGVAGFMPEVMAVYRVHAGGVFSVAAVEKQMRMSISGLRPAWRHFSAPAQRRLFSARLASDYTALAFDCLRRGKLIAFLESYARVLRYACLPPNAAALEKFAGDHGLWAGRVARKILRGLRK